MTWSHLDDTSVVLSTPTSDSNGVISDIDMNDQGAPDAFPYHFDEETWDEVGNNCRHVFTIKVIWKRLYFQSLHDSDYLDFHSPFILQFPLPRSPDYDTKTWCYTTDLGRRWDYCKVPPCDGKFTSETVDFCKFWMIFIALS